MIKKIINADDYGFSLGVNAGIQKAALEGILNSTSVMVNQKYAWEELEKLITKKDFAIGLHINLTNGKAISDSKDIPLLVQKDGTFKNGFLKLFLLGFLHPKKLYQQTKKEIENQLKLLQEHHVLVKHLDSHRHVHMIPAIFKATLELQQKYNIPRVRIINENPFRTMKDTPSFEYIKDGGLIKWGVLFSCFIINKALFHIHTKTYFFSILHTCKITKEKVKKIRVAKTYDTIEIMIHPAIPEIDKEHLMDISDTNVLKYERTQELETALCHEINQLEIR